MQLSLSRRPRITRFLPVLICGLFLFCSSISQAQQTVAAAEVTPQQMLSRMWQSSRQTDYQGVFTYQQGSQLDSFRVVHWVEEGKEYESLSRLNGNDQEVVRSGNTLGCRRTGENLLAEGESLESLYRMTLHGQERVAGRTADKLLLEPKDYARNGHRLWLDSDTGLLLKSEVLEYSNGRSLLERFQFIDLQVGQVSRKPLDGQQLAVDLLPCEGSEPVAKGRWQIDQPPKGFVLSDVRQQAGGERLLYSDGMASFSVLIEPVDTATPDSHGSRGATVLCVSHLRDVNQRLYSVSVVGEIPMPLAKRLVRSVRETAP